MDFNAVELGKNSYSAVNRAVNHWKNSLVDSLPKLLILTYHRILPEIECNPLHAVVSLKTFTKQIDGLAKKYPIISLSDAVGQCRQKQSREEIQIVLTFDDAYRDVYEFAFPILRKRGLPASIFLPTDYIGSGVAMWDHELILLLKKDKTITEINLEDEKIRSKFMQSRRSFIMSAFNKMKSLDIASSRKVINLLKAGRENIRLPDITKIGFISWEQAREMSSAGLEIASHGLTHRSLTRVPFKDAVEEIRRSKEIVEHNIERPCLHFAFPFGSKYDYNASLINYVKESGYESCLLNVHGYNHIGRDSFCFKRIAMKETTNARHMLG